MSKKLILIPVDMYKGLINSTKKSIQTDDEVLAPKGTNLEYAKKETKNQLKGLKIKNVRQKKGKYTRDLRRFLKMRKEKLEKPINVNVKNAKLLIKPNTGEVASLSETGDVESLGQLRSPFAQSTPNGSARKSSLHEETTPRKSQRSEKSKKKIDQRKGEINLKVKEFMNYVLKNNSKFGVTSEGYVIGNNNKVIQGSNLAESVRRLIDPNLKDNYSPPGTKKLRGLVLKDVYLKNLMDKNYVLDLDDSFKSLSDDDEINQSGSGVFHFRPTLWIRG